ncbi:hypothetical protein RMSM_02242 [Rhodopirellula maiorica SM1]|uniref:Uncharacterized protein n=1 Tax=Rhodopirellula maiorica SM1 TaxID=1265738 RepID=M5RNR9_9BACT|nr:hypothetical protein RMSM_02242 [Rhodopirellula maiorica SM1]
MIRCANRRSACGPLPKTVKRGRHRIAKRAETGLPPMKRQISC